MSAFADLLDLQTAVVEHVRKPEIADVFPRLVALAESRLNRSLRMREQISTATVTFTAGRAALPTGFVEMIKLGIPNGCEYVQQAPQSTLYGVYSIQGDELVAPNVSGDLRADYYASIPALVGMTSSNWLLARYPDVYLYAVAFEAAKYTHDAEMAMATKGLMDEAVSSAKGDDASARYSRARVRVAGCTP